MRRGEGAVLLSCTEGLLQSCWGGKPLPGAPGGLSDGCSVGMVTEIVKMSCFLRALGEVSSFKGEGRKKKKRNEIDCMQLLLGVLRWLGEENPATRLRGHSGALRE